MIAGIYDKLCEFLGPVSDALSAFFDEYIAEYWNKFVSNFIEYFTKLLIPDIAFLRENFDMLYYSLAERFPILNDISDMYAMVRLSFETASSTPDVSFTYKGVKYDFFKYLYILDPIIPFLHSVILVFAYYRFLSGLFKKLPNII